MKKLLLILGCVLSLSVFSADFHSKNLIVKLKNGKIISQIKDIIYSKNLYANVYLIRLSQNKKIANLNPNDFIFIAKDSYSKRSKLPEPVFINSKNKNLPTSSIFNDPRTSFQWLIKDSLNNGISQEKAYRNRRSSVSEKIIVAVVDTGVDINHEDLKDVMWTNQNEIPNNGIDDDNNGYIDDIHGISTLKRDSNGNATGDITPVHPHGTHVSGIIAAKQNNNKGIAGVASNVSIMGIQTVPGRGDELDSDVIESFIYAAKNGARIINCSFGKNDKGSADAVSDAIDYIGREYGVLVIASAGNDSQNIDVARNYKYPAALSNETLLVVASTNRRGGISYFSNIGQKNVDLAAPGTNIYSTVPNNRYANMSGTSMAAPTVSGVAAEVLSSNPSLNALELKNLLMETLTFKKKWSKKMASPGIINLNKALNR